MGARRSLEVKEAFRLVVEEGMSGHAAAIKAGCTHAALYRYPEHRKLKGLGEFIPPSKFEDPRLPPEVDHAVQYWKDGMLASDAAKKAGVRLRDLQHHPEYRRLKNLKPLLPAKQHD